MTAGHRPVMAPTFHIHTLRCQKLRAAYQSLQRVLWNGRQCSGSMIGTSSRRHCSVLRRDREQKTDSWDAAGALLFKWVSCQASINKMLRAYKHSTLLSDSTTWGSFQPQPCLGQSFLPANLIRTVIWSTRQEVRLARQTRLNYYDNASNKMG